MTSSSRTIVSVVSGLLLVVATALSVWKPEATFSIAADTQILTWYPAAHGIPMWQFRAAQLYRGSESEPVAFAGNVEATPNAVITLTRLGSGPLSVTVEQEEASQPVLNLYGLDEGFIEAVNERVVFIVDIDEAADAIVLLLSGRVDIGQDFSQYGSESPELLKAARVSILGHTIVGRSRYDGGSTDLDAGDFVSFGNVNETQGDVAVGQVIVDQESNITVITRVIADSVTVRRFSSQGYAIESTLYSRLTNDTTLQALWASFLFFYGVRHYLTERLPD